MFDLSFAEIAIVAVVAVIFIGPKELPTVVRAIAKAMRSLRSVMREIRAAFDDVARQSGVQDMANELDNEVRLIRGDDGKWYESYDVPKPQIEAGDDKNP